MLSTFWLTFYSEKMVQPIQVIQLDESSDEEVTIISSTENSVNNWFTVKEEENLPIDLSKRRPISNQSLLLSFLSSGMNS